MEGSEEFLSVVRDDVKMDHLRSMSENALLCREDELHQQVITMMSWTDADAVLYVCGAVGAWWAARACREDAGMDKRRLGAWCSALYPSVEGYSVVDFTYVYDLIAKLIGADQRGPKDPATGQYDALANVHGAFGVFLYGTNPWRDDLWQEMVEDMRGWGPLENS